MFEKFIKKPDAAPVAQKPRPVPCIKTWLEQGIADDIFEEVADGKPITWCSMFVQPKPRLTNVSMEDLKLKVIRACIDLRIPKKAHVEDPNITGSCCRRLQV